MKLTWTKVTPVWTIFYVLLQIVNNLWPKHQNAFNADVIELQTSIYPFIQTIDKKEDPNLNINNIIIY